MNREIQKIKGALADLEQRKKDIEVRLSGYVMALRDNLDPMLPVHKLPSAVILSQAVELEAWQTELKIVRGEIAKARDLLGLD